RLCGGLGLRSRLRGGLFGLLGRGLFGVVGGLFFSHFLALLNLCVDFPLAHDRQRSCDLALGLREASRVVKLARGVLKTQTEQLAARGQQVLAQLVVTHVAQLDGLHRYASSRNTNLVRTGSLWPASRIASRASGS